ncbi:MAG: NAD-dependent dehydratase, partial [Parvibaculales bacterium]
MTDLPKGYQLRHLAEVDSTNEEARRMAAALGVKPRLPSVPAGLLRLAGRLTGRGPAIARLTGSLQL